MTELTEAERDQAIRALQQWFISQSINPQDAGLMLVKMLGKLLTQKTTDLNELTEAIGDFKLLLMMEIVGYIKGYNHP